MSHCRIALIGTHDDLDWIYENCTTDSSSESQAEQAFGYDNLSENKVPYKPTVEELNAFFKKYPDINKEKYLSTSHIWWKESDWREPLPLFTKKDTLAWQQLCSLNFYEILDLRPRRDWVNFEWNFNEKRKKTSKELIADIIALPDNITFFFGEAHL